MESLLLEIGTEEIPAGYIQPALDALAAGLTQKLLHARIDHGAIGTYGTPRRLAVVIEAVAPRQKPLTEQVLGPPERICLDPEGGFTMAAEKFAQKVGASPEQLQFVDTAKGRYICAQLSDPGIGTHKLLRRLLPDIIVNIPFPP